MLGYKGFDKNFQCRGFQYAVGQTYQFDGDIKAGKCGFHFHTNPLGVFELYPPTNSRFALVDAVGNVDEPIWDPSVKCTDEITIVRELSLDELIAEADVFTNLKGNYRSVAVDELPYSTACTTASESVAINRGKHSSIAVAGGRESAAYVTGKNSIAVATGFHSKAKGALGCWLVLAEQNDYGITDVQVFKVDGVKIKPDTFYSLKDGKPVEVNQLQEV